MDALAAVLLRAILKSPKARDRELVAAAESGDLNQTRELLSDEAEPRMAWKSVSLTCRVVGDNGESTTESRHRNCESALAAAIIGGHEDIVRLLLAYNASPNGSEDWYIAGCRSNGTWTGEDWAKCFPVHYEFDSPLALALGRGATTTNDNENLDTSLAHILMGQPSLQQLANRGHYLINKPGAFIVLENPVSQSQCAEMVQITPHVGIIRALIDAGATISDGILELAIQHNDRRFVELLEEQLPFHPPEDEPSGATFVARAMTVVQPNTDTRGGTITLQVGQTVFCVRTYNNGRAYGRNISTNRYGFFPSACIREIENTIPDPSPSRAPASSSRPLPAPSPRPTPPLSTEAPLDLDGILPPASITFIRSATSCPDPEIATAVSLILARSPDVIMDGDQLASEVVELLLSQVAIAAEGAQPAQPPPPRPTHPALCPGTDCTLYVPSVLPTAPRSSA
ncbi:hypothetical protein M427DRAFT_28973 [Gonapodya prolifera JEL478]|uniref:SH3 domain-containing protein n=1 Tax=Gonapodya prolifera (strain JEL478) TaxID=1344416 RepID=A0A139AS12_GONPJ|nr:hypothetical protein M427DRAFT_28973 [Gonapodya prolifera JEL478]|eukprot:KXS19527.1 hypothetical protein M427DRAFT_28973 [Gonapodya prolifera JEL478]